MSLTARIFIALLVLISVGMVATLVSILITLLHDTPTPAQIKDCTERKGTIERLGSRNLCVIQQVSGTRLYFY